MKIRPIRKEYLASVADLHLNYLPSKFSKTKLSCKILQYIYHSFVHSKHDIALVSDIDGQIIGYVCLVTSLKRLYIAALKNNHVYLLFNVIALMVLQSQIITRDICPKIRSLSNFRNDNSCHGQTVLMNVDNMKELRPIVVRADYQESLVAKALLHHAEEWLKLSGEHKYFLRLYRSNVRAINFYRKAGFKVAGTEGADTLIMEKTLT
jgi:GNAT superfamily N-acetyltransferase